MSCRKFQKHVIQLIHNELSIDMERKLHKHLDTCASCRKTIKKNKDLRTIAKQAMAIKEPNWHTMDKAIDGHIKTLVSTSTTRKPLIIWQRAFVPTTAFILIGTSVVFAFTYHALMGSTSEPSTTTNTAIEDRNALKNPKGTALEHSPDRLASPRKTAISTPETESLDTMQENSLLEIEHLNLDRSDKVTTRVKERSLKRKWGTLSTQLIQDTLTPVKRKIQRCYEGVLKRNPNLIARPKITIAIDRQGRVSKVKINDLDDSPVLYSCIEQYILEATFPKPDGGPVEVVMPLRLYPKQ